MAFVGKAIFYFIENMESTFSPLLSKFKINFKNVDIRY